jgi:hypothetical protein
MPITNYLPSSRLIQPGVCTSTTRPASPFEGQAIFETNTDRMLIWNGTAWVVPNAPAQNPTGLELISSSTFSNQSFVETTGFSSTYEWYQINFSGLKTTSSSSSVTGVLYDGATARNSLYYGNNFSITYLGSSGQQFAQNNSANFYGTTLENRYRANFSMNVFYKSGEQFTYNTNGFDGNAFASFFGGGFRAATDSWDRIRWTNSTGNMTGEISIYGYRK